jgi:hypothetical protein
MNRLEPWSLGECTDHLGSRKSWQTLLLDRELLLLYSTTSITFRALLYNLVYQHSSQEAILSFNY